MTAQFTDRLMGGDPNGVMCARKDDALRRSIPQRQAFRQQIGYRFRPRAGRRRTPLDAHYTMAKAHWHLRFERTPGQRISRVAPAAA